MKILISVITLFCAINMATAQPCRLLLIPVNPVMKEGAEVYFDLFVYNTGKATVKIPNLDKWSASCKLRDACGNRSQQISGFAEFVDHPAADHPLAPGSMEHRRIKLKIEPNKGDVAEVYVEAGPKNTWRSNTALLFCPQHTN